MVAAVGSQHLLAAGVQPRHANRVVGCLGSTVGEEHHVQIAGRQLGNESCGLAASFVGMERSNGAQLAGLLLNCSDKLGVLMPNVYVHELA